jgi:hypothetical protein
MEVIMHNLISYNQLAYWHQTEKEEKDTVISDYFQCITECDDDTQTCKRICRHILST